MKKMVLGLTLLFLMLMSCKPEEVKTTDTQSNNETHKKTGLVMVVKSPTGSLVKYFENLPEGNADLSDGKDFQLFHVLDAFDGSLFLRAPDFSNSLTKYVITDKGEFENAGEFATPGQIEDIAIRDAETGVFFDRGDGKTLTVFNPKTMKISGNINMNGALFPEDELTRYRDLFIRDNLVFAPLAKGRGIVWYNPLVVHVADINTGTFVGNTSVKLDGPVRHNIFFGGKNIDENRNIYVTELGDLLSGTPARLHRINNGSTDFDPTYEFDLASGLNDQNQFHRVYNAFTCIGNGKALVSVTRDTPSEINSILNGIDFKLSDLTQSQKGEIQVILNNAENAVWCVVDLEAKSVTPISGIPAQNVDHRFIPTEFDGKWYLGIENSSEIAYYSYDPATGNGEKAFDVVGGSLSRLINLANNN